MIRYPEGAFGFQILFRLHGSAVFKAVMPALLSSAIYLVLFHASDLEEEGNEIMDHPYPMGALVGAFTFLLSFRANFAYNRYWEAFTAVHQMHSKWLDVGIYLASFHLQSSRYDSIKPPSFGANPHLTSLERERERLHEPTREDVEHQIDGALEKEQESKRASRFSKWRLMKRRKKKNTPAAAVVATAATVVTATSAAAAAIAINKNGQATAATNNSDKNKAEVKLRNIARQTPLRRTSLEVRIKEQSKNINAPPPPKTTAKRRRTNVMGMGHRRVVSAISCVTAASPDNMAPDALDERPLFLQEAAHLLSLLSAVAFSTLRNDLENAESPLIPFTPGAPFPCVDPDGITADIRDDWGLPTDHLWFPTLQFLFGLSRNETSRALYNAARPFRVIGGISDNEVALLQAARGPQAKVNLVNLWLQEFIAREYLAGSTGSVAPPIISRLFQYVSDGTLGYNQARKVAYIPFPFAHAQITCLFVLVIVAFIPVLMLTYLTNEWFGFALNMLTVLCFAGLHEVSRELENPFQNAPNDLPANNFHAQFNEALMTMFAGYHPDAYWEVKEVVVDEPEGGQQVADLDLGALVADLDLGGTGEANSTRVHPLLGCNANKMDESIVSIDEKVSITKHKT